MKGTMKFLLPYDKKQIPVEIDDKNFAGTLVSKVENFKPGLSQEQLVEASLDNPIGSPKLEELAKGKKNIVIISSDHTRPVPSKIITPILLRRIRSAQPDANIKILVATGFHRPSTHEELVDKYGQEIVDMEQIVMHVSTDDSAMKKIGTLPSGGECIINRVAAEADLLLSQGFIESHFFAGFSGGRKSVLPGIASYKTIMANHCSEFIASPKARAGHPAGKSHSQRHALCRENGRFEIHPQRGFEWRQGDHWFFCRGFGGRACQGNAVPLLTGPGQ